MDTHCHIHDSELTTKYSETSDQLIDEARAAGVSAFVCVGTDLKSSSEAIEFVRDRQDCYASLALHPHEAAQYTEKELTTQMQAIENLLNVKDTKVVAIGECGLDYFYHNDPKTRHTQAMLLRQHLALAQKHNLPVIFHVRDAFDDFFKIIDEYKGVQGVVHSFSATKRELDGVVQRGFYVGLNGIMTFTKNPDQLEAARIAPLERIVVETDAPFLTPSPFRGKICKPKHVSVTAKFLSRLRGETLKEFTAQTTKNAKQLFGL